MSKRRRLGPAQGFEAVSRGEWTAVTASRSLVTPGLASAPAGAGIPGLAPVARVASDAALAAAFEEVAGALGKARAEGRLVQDLPLEAIEASHLVRDRLPVWDAAMEDLLASLRARGQQQPIEVVRLGEESWGLISGWRRLTALRRLAEEAAAEGLPPPRVLAIERRPDSAAEAYLAMVEENEVRADLSHYERARIAARAVAGGVFPTEKVALLTLFRHASRPRRSKIRAFLPIVRELDAALRFPAALGERLGLRLGRALVADPALGPNLAARLASDPPADAGAEQAIIEALLATPKPAQKRRVSPAFLSGDDLGPPSDVESTADLGEASEPCPGIRLAAAVGGGLVLDGPGVDAAFRDRLVAWLRGGGR